MNALIDTSGFLISSAMRATTRVSSWSCSAARRSERELALRRQVLEDQHRAHGRRAFAHHGVGRDLERQAPQRELDLAARDRAASRERLVEEIAQRARAGRAGRGSGRRARPCRGFPRPGGS